MGNIRETEGLFEKTRSAKLLKKINWFKGFFRISFIACAITSITFGFIVFEKKERFLRYYEITFNEEEKAQCLDEILKNCRPEIVKSIQSIGDHVSLFKDEHRLLQMNRIGHLTPEIIMNHYQWSRNADKNGGFVFKLYIPAHGPRAGKLSAPSEIEPYIQSAINRTIDDSCRDFLGVIGKEEKGLCIYKQYYLITGFCERLIFALKCSAVMCLISWVFFAFILPLLIKSMLFFFGLFEVTFCLFNKPIKWLSKGFRNS